MTQPGSLDAAEPLSKSLEPTPGSQSSRSPGSERLPADDEAWVGLGSNLGDRERYIAQALGALEPWLVASSPVYETAPWGIPDQPWFLNLVARLRWTAPARELLACVLSVEHSMGRTRALRFGPRCIDIDVLLVGRQQIEESGLVVPHPGIASRRSVLEPWGDLSPELVLPGLDQTVAALRSEALPLEGQEVRPWLSASS